MAFWCGRPPSSGGGGRLDDGARRGRASLAQKAKEKEEGEQLVDKLDSDSCSFIPKQLSRKFEDNYINGIDYDPDREREQLKKRLKSERKGAMREIPKHNNFLAAAKDCRMKQEQAEKYGRMVAFLQEQERAFKSGQLGKGKKRRR